MARAEFEKKNTHITKVQVVQETTNNGIQKPMKTASKLFYL